MSTCLTLEESRNLPVKSATHLNQLAATFAVAIIVKDLRVQFKKLFVSPLENLGSVSSSAQVPLKHSLLGDIVGAVEEKDGAGLSDLTLISNLT